MNVLRRILSYWLAIAVLVLGVVGFLRFQQLADWWVLRSYTAPAAISQLASDDGLTNLGKHYLYINKPVLEGKEPFNQHCNNAVEQTVVLGCYHGNRQGIYLYDVTDDRLAGVEQVTAAHEMLHQAYDRLSNKERTRIDGLLDNYYQTKLTDPNVLKQMAGYKKSEPGQLHTEMHSIFGTEIADLPPELEQYYKQYFDDRAKVVNFSNTYEAAFTQRNDQIAAYDAQLTDLKTRIDSQEAELKDRSSQLSVQKANLDSLRASDIPAYNAAVPGYNSLVNTYNAVVANTKDLISQYNSIVDQRNSIAVQEQQLQSALDSRLQTAPGQ